MTVEPWVQSIATEVVLFSRTLGVNAGAPRVLHAANNVVMHLSPSDVVAKVARTHDARAGLQRELEVLKLLQAAGALVVAPAAEADPGPHETENLELILLEYTPPSGRQIPLREAVQTLHQVHKHLAEIDIPLPTLGDHFATAARALEEVSITPALKSGDRNVLEIALDRLRADVDGTQVSRQPIHGDPWSGNFLPARNQALLLDFETVCIGPREWDIAALPERVDPAFTELDQKLIREARVLRSVLVATWCWRIYGTNPAIDQAAEHHLNVVKQARKDGKF